MTINFDHVTEQIQVTDAATNASLTVQPKGTGSFNIAAGSSGVNLSNGGTVTAITRTAAGSGYTTIPSVVISAPTTAGGVQATASPVMQNLSATPSAGGTGYVVGDTVTLVGGTPVSVSATFRVATVSGGAITSLDSPNFAAYTALPTNPVSVTGGTGSGATLTCTWLFGFANITNAGSGYVEQPTVTFSGGGGSGAAAFARVGGTVSLTSLGSTLNLNTEAGTGFRVLTAGTTATDMWQAISNGTTAILRSSNSTSNAQVQTSGTGGVQLGTSSGVTQCLVSHTASAVNYVQVTGAATGSGPTISAQGSDTNVDLKANTKGTGSFRVSTGTGEMVRVADSSGTGYVQLSGGTTPYIVAQGSTNANLSLGSNGTGTVFLRTNGGGTTQAAVSHTASAVNYVQVTGAATGGNPYFLSAGSDSNIGLVLASKGTGAFGFWTNGGANQQFSVTHTASAVNRIQVTGAATGSDPVLSAQGSDTNIDLVLSPKGTGALQAQLTDSTATGGNARGVNAVDWQTSRTAAGQVASGSYSVIVGGSGNTASGFNASVVGGASNVASNNYAFVGGGIANSANFGMSGVVAGYSNQALGYLNFIGGGYLNSGTSNSTVTTQSATMNGTTAVTLSGPNANIKVGQLIIGTSITSFPYTYVAAISGTSLTLSQAASGSSTSTLSFYTPHGVVVGGGNNTATGSYSFIGGGGDAGTAGNRNVASGDWSVVVGGRNNTASGIASFVGSGGTNPQFGVFPNTASGVGASIVGGFSNNASALGSSVLGGYGNIANASFSAALSGNACVTRSIIGYLGFGTGTAYGNGTSQGGFLILHKQTTDATPTVLTTELNAGGTLNQVILPNNSAYYFRGEIVSGVTGGGNTKGWTIEGVIKRGANAASTTLVGSTVTSLYADAGASTWTIALTADTTNGGLAVTFTGQAATTIRCVAQIRTTEMTY